MEDMQCGFVLKPLLLLKEKKMDDEVYVISFSTTTNPPLAGQGVKSPCRNKGR
jgi:hypothetical protein